jgi:hypothetical protein
MSIMSPNRRLAATVAEQLRGDRVTVGLVVDQHAPEVVAGLRIEGFEERAEVGISVDHAGSSGAPTRRSTQRTPRYVSQMGAAISVRTAASGPSRIKTRMK